jgi:hypothetical protein
MMNAKLLKRTAIVVKPKEPYIKWANSLDDGVKLGDDVKPEHTVYLIEDISDSDIVDIEVMVEPHYQFIFEEELAGWYQLESAWPDKRDLTTFLEWFEITYHSMVIDLCPGRIKTERYEGY